LRNKRRNNCPACRFNRCLESGLRPELVRSGQSERMALASQLNLGKEPMEAKKESGKPKELDMWESVMACHRLVLSQTAGISLMVVPSRVTAALANRIREEEEREGVVQEVLQMARIEHAFLTAKECVGFFNESLSREKMELARQQGAYPALVFTAVQEFFVQLIVIFLKSCQHFQALTWPCQARLLRKNIAEISLILTTMCFHREQQMFRWGMSERDQTMAARGGAHLSPVVEVDETTLSAHLTESISKDIFHMVSSLALLDIPNHIHILLILIQVFTRDGQQMEKQSKVDAGRSYYLQLLFKYMEVTHPREECPRLIATLHRVLQTVKESAEKIRAFEIVSVKM